MNIPWDRPRLFTRQVDKPIGYEIATPARNTTRLFTERESVKGAKVEGGQREDLRLKRKKYSVTASVRKLSGRKAPYHAEDGIVEGEFGLILVPRDTSCEGFYIERTTVKIQDEFTPAQGSQWNVTWNAMYSAQGTTIKWGTSHIYKDGDDYVVTFTERSSSDTEPLVVSWRINDEANPCIPTGLPIVCCFAHGYWINDMPWDNKLGWINR